MKNTFLLSLQIITRYEKARRSHKVKKTLRKKHVPQNLERLLHVTEECSFFPFWHAVSRKTISRTPHGKEQKRKSPHQMMVAGARTSGIEEWKWGQEREHLYGLMQLEITQYLEGIS